MPNTIADNLQRLVNAKGAIATAITNRGGTVGSSDGLEDFASDIAAIPNTYAAGDEGKVVSNGALVAQGSDAVTANNTYDTTLISSLTVNVPSSGGGGAPESDVNFRDYDGTIVALYSAADFAELTALPENPTHDGLTAQGWNWTLSDAKSYVAKYGKLEIGQMYITTDGKTHIHIVLEDGRLEPVLGLGVNGSVDIDWGDGTEHTTLTGTNVNTYVATSPHTYATAGAYTIKLSVTGSMSFVPKNNVCGLLMKSGYGVDQSRCYINSIKSVNVGNSVTSIRSSVFQSCYSLSSVTIPDSVTSIGSSVFQSCYSLSSITIPDSVTSIGSNAFQSCLSLSSITIPDSVTSIGSSVFYYCYSLSSVTIPDSVTSIGSNAFCYCFGVGKIIFESTMPPTAVASAFVGVPTDCAILVKSYAYLSASGYPSPSAYTYAYYDTVADATALPSTIPNEPAISLTWYATIADLREETNPITVGNGKEVYAKMTERTIIKNFTSSVNEVNNGTTLTTSVSCNAGDLVVATVVIRGNTYSLSSGWTLLGISEIVGDYNQRTLMVYKIAESSTESITITQDSSGRIYTNLVAITGATVGTFSGFTTQSSGGTITMQRPNGLIIWGVSSSLWGSSAPYDLWGISNTNDIYAIELPNTTQPRCLTALDQGNDPTVNFTYSPSTQGDGGLAAASLVVTGITEFWNYAD